MPYESTSLTTARREIGRALGIFRSGAVTALTTTSVTIPSLYLNTNRGSTQAADETIIFRPDATAAADNKRYIGSVDTSTGAVTVAGGANYTDTTATSEVAEIWELNIDPQVDVLDALNYSLDYTMVRTFYMLSNAYADFDYHMQETTAADFTSVGSPTVAKTTANASPRQVPFGQRGLRVTNGTANHGVRTSGILSIMGHQMQAHVIASVVVGSATISAYDVTNAAVFGDAVTVEESAPVLVRLPWQDTPDTCKEVSLSLLGDTATSDIIYSAAGIVLQGNRRFSFPSAISERFKAPSIFMAVPQEETSTTNVYSANSVDFVPLVEGEDFSFIMHHPDANPYGITLLRDLHLDWPLFVEAQIPASDLGTFSTEASTTVAPANVFIPRAVLRILDHVILPRFGTSERWVAVRAIAQKELDDALKVRTTPVVAPQRKPWGGPTRGRI